MEVDIFTLSDHSQDFNGKLVIVGTFDTIWAPNFPFTFPSFSIAVRLRFNRIEIGNHRIQITVFDPNRRESLPQINGDFQVQIPPGNEIGTANFSITVGQPQFQVEGMYTVELRIDNNVLKSVPLFVRRRQ